VTGAAAILAGCFVWHALRSAEPFLPLPLLSGSVVPFAIAASGCAMGAMIGLTVHLPLYYEVVYALTAAQAGLALIPIAAISVAGAAFAGRSMSRSRHYKRVPMMGSALAALMALALALATPLPLWALLTVLGIFSVGLGTTFPVTVVSIQNAVARAQVGTATGAMNFFRALMASFTVAAFTTVLLMALGTSITISGDHASSAHPIAAADMVAAFRYVFAASAVMLALSALFLTLMEERVLAGPAKVNPGLAE
jgi:hypothetical protein